MTQKTDYRTMVEKDYLGQWDLEGRADAIVLIEKVEPYAPEKRKTKMVDGARVEEKNKRIKVTFRGKRKAWLAGPVSLKAISGMYGPKVNDWIGKRVAIYVDSSVMFGKTRVGGIRVRPTIPALGVKLSERTLDQPVDPAKAAEIEAAKAATFDEDTERKEVNPDDDGR
jgi:hypothetical protein